jgi:hypothetical protein
MRRTEHVAVIEEEETAEGILCKKEPMGRIKRRHTDCINMSLKRL